MGVVLGKPEIVDSADSVMAKYSVEVDSDADGIAAVKAGIFIELNKKEALDEAVQKVVASSSLPDWLKNAIKPK